MGNLVVFAAHPLKQGLKLTDLHSDCQNCRYVFAAHPLKQGLKHIQ